MSIYNPMYMISRRPPPIETVGGDTRGTAPYVVTDGVRMLEVFHVQDMAYELGEPSYRQRQSRRRHVDGLICPREDSASTRIYTRRQRRARRFRLHERHAHALSQHGQAQA